MRQTARSASFWKQREVLTAFHGGKGIFLQVDSGRSPQTHGKGAKIRSLTVLHERAALSWQESTELFWWNCRLTGFHWKPFKPFETKGQDAEMDSSLAIWMDIWMETWQVTEITVRWQCFWNNNCICEPSRPSTYKQSSTANLYSTSKSTNIHIYICIYVSNQHLYACK